MRGRGKTNSTKVDFQEVEPLFIVDLRNEYRHIPPFYSFKNFAVWMQHNGAAQAKAEGKKMQWRFAFSNHRDWCNLFKILSCFKDTTIIVDEADALFQDNKFKKLLIDLFLGARNNNVNLVFIGKRPVLIPITVRSQVDEFYIFAVAENWDVKYLEQRTRQDFPKEPWSLKKGECIHIKEGEKPRLKQYPLFQVG